MLNMEDASKSFVNKKKIFKLRKSVHIKWKFDTRSRGLVSDCRQNAWNCNKIIINFWHINAKKRL